jgi:glycine/serine hydroxymethyltransferase
MGAVEMAEIGRLIVAGIAARGDPAAQAAVRDRVVALAERYPVPGLAWTRA